MDARIAKPEVAQEFLTPERCWILEVWNDAADESVSVARARVEVGVTTQAHRLNDVIERYLIVAGAGIVQIGNSIKRAVVPGDVVVIPSGISQQITNTGSSDLLFYCICSPRFTLGCYESLEQERDATISLEAALLPAQPNYSAPDGSEIRLLSNARGGGLCHCTLPPGVTSRAVVHRSVEEIWYFLEGRGQVWRKFMDAESEMDVAPGISLSIPAGTHFQFRNIGREPLRLIIATMPPWPGAEEAISVEGIWQATPKGE
jgi:mannose-6-phosphate isomerase-like protein (cupin superfamily)